MTNKKYSDWIRVDLHIHTDFSKKTKQNDYKGEFSVSTLKTKLKENNVEIFSLTDHNIINLPAYREYYESYDINNDPLLLPGIEMDLEVEHKGETRTYHTLLVFKEATAEKVINIDRLLEKEYADKNITNPFDRKLNFTQVVNLFNKDEFFFIIHAHRHKTGIVDAYKGHIADAQEMILLMPSALEKVKEEAIVHYNENFDRFLSPEFKNRRDIAYINFSDNHNIQSYPCIHMGDQGNHSFYYLKGTKSYETLRLAFIDPESRIKSTLQYNEIDKNINYIESLKIDNHLSMCEKELSFSPHLNVIIGGRSSGKSLLMYLIGEKVDSVKTNRESFYQEIADKNKIYIKTKRSSDFSSKASISPDPVYINQGDIVNYFEKKELKELANKSHKLVEYNELRKSFEANANIFKEIVKEAIESYGNALNIENIKYIFYKLDVEHYFNDKYIVILKKEEIQEAFYNSDEITDLVRHIDDIGVSIERLEKSEIIKFSKDEQKLIRDLKVLLDRKKEELSQINYKTTKKNKFLDVSESIINAVNLKQDDDARKKLQSRDSLKAMIENIRFKFLTMKKMKECCDKIEKYSYSLSKSVPLNEGINLILEVEENENIKSIILDGLNQSQQHLSLYRNFIKLLGNKEGIKNYSDNSSDTLKKKILGKQLEGVLEMMKNPQDYLKYSATESSKNKSPGFNSEKYLEIVLKNNNNNMIFIDQPEDNLENKYIAKSLVGTIRSIKFKKQIFLVTHNPSIVVYGDAESIIIAEHKNNKISYNQVVLEDKFAQKEICQILDGGEYVFNNRSRKYDIKRILKEGGQSSE